MKSWLVTVLILALVLIAIPAFAAQKTEATASVPKYDPATEALFKGTVVEVKDRQCPVSGGVGSHVVLKLGDGKTIEVHLAPTAFVKTYELIFKPGDQIEVTGVKVIFEDVETIFAREVRRGTDIFDFRDKQGRPAW
jgi:DNA/RNA endonuclease YhcR with UshA esterase domain